MADIEDDNLNDEGNIDATDPIVRRAHRRFRKCQRYETEARNNWMSDYKFANGDVYNNYQWPIDIYQDRGNRPSLTVNETRQHNLHIINEAKQNKAEVKYRPTGAGATEAAAEVYEGLYRHISNISNAQMAQGQAISFQVQAGLGFTVIEADFVEASPKPDSDAFNQEIYIRGVNDPMSVMLDCDCPEPDGTGARYGFIFTDRPKDEVVEKYPQLRGRIAVANAVDGEDAGWIRDDHVRECQYFEVTEDKDELLGDDQGTVIFASQAPAPLRKRWEEEAEANGTKLKSRPIIRKSVKSHLIVGNDLIKTDDLPGTAVPIVPWCGEITIIDKRMDRKGHTRAMISAQQMANYNYSASVEYGALQSKSPYIAPAAAIEGYETYWETANTVNHSILPYKHKDDEGGDIPSPQRQEPPTAAPVFIQGVEQAQKFMLTVSGQYEAEMGAPGNEKSGRAINERQRQGDRATYHFIDAQALAIRRQGVIVKEWIPVIYDTVRTAKILGLDGEESEVQINPDAAEAHSVQQQGAAIARIFNPKIGSYEVVSDVGPNYATQRQEAFNAIVQILTQAPQLIEKVGDILFKVADFPMADELADRLKPGLPPEAQMQLDQLQKVLQQSQERGLNTEKLLHQAMEALAEERLKAKAKDQAGVVDEFKADTDRAKMLIDAATKADIASAIGAIREMLPQVVRQAMQDNLGPVRTAAAGDLTDDFTGGGNAGLDSATPLPVPDVGQQAAQPGGQ